MVLKYTPYILLSVLLIATFITPCSASELNCPPKAGTPKTEDVNNDGVKDWLIERKVLDDKGTVQELWCIDQNETKRNDEYFAKRVGKLWCSICFFKEGNNSYGILYKTDPKTGKPEDKNNNEKPDEAKGIVWVNWEDDTNKDCHWNDDDNDGKVDVIVYFYNITTQELVIISYELDPKQHPNVTKTSEKVVEEIFVKKAKPKKRVEITRAENPEDIYNTLPNLVRDGLCLLSRIDPKYSAFISERFEEVFKEVPITIAPITLTITPSYVEALPGESITFNIRIDSECEEVKLKAVVSGPMFEKEYILPTQYSPFPKDYAYTVEIPRQIPPGVTLKAKIIAECEGGIVEEDVEVKIKMPTPGFEVLLAAAGLLGAAYLRLRRSR
jgi:hypothetical protein